MAKTCKATQGSITLSSVSFALLMLFLVLLFNNNVPGQALLDNEQVSKQSKTDFDQGGTSFYATRPASSFAAGNRNTKREFQTAAHRVPSGPNPESN